MNVPETAQDFKQSGVKRLAQYVRDVIRHDMVNGYTMLSPRVCDGVTIFKVKDARTEKMLRVIIMEEDS